MRIRLVALVVLALLGGCAGGLDGVGGPGGGGGASEATNPPGVNETGLHNASALVEAHEASLAGRAHVAELWSNSTARNASVPVGGSRHVVHRVGDGGAPRLSTDTVSGTFATNRTTTRWQNESVGVLRRVEKPVFRAERTWYRLRDPVAADDPARTTDLLVRQLEVGNFTMANATTVDGTRIVTLSADGIHPDEDVTRGELTSYDARLRVDGTGRIRSATVEYGINATTVGGPIAIDATITYEVRDVGGPVSAERPDWFEEAIAEAPDVRIQAEVVEGRAVAVTNEGGDPIPADALYMLVEDGEGAASGGLDAPVEPGETVYLTVTNDTGQTEVARSLPDQSPSLDGEYVVNVGAPPGPLYAEATVHADGE